MNEGSGIATRKETEHAVREQRSAAALRDNLRRRKEQARARGGPAAAPLPAVLAPAASIAAASAGDRTGLSPAPLSSKTSRHGGTTAD